MSDFEFEFTDRYKALGIPYPDPETVCDGQCEGTGFVPIHKNDMEEPFHTLWLEAEKQNPTDDGYHFIKCPDCNGTGRRKEIVMAQGGGKSMNDKQLNQLAKIYSLAAELEAMRAKNLICFANVLGIPILTLNQLAKICSLAAELEAMKAKNLICFANVLGIPTLTLDMYDAKMFFDLAKKLEELSESK